MTELQGTQLINLIIELKILVQAIIYILFAVLGALVGSAFVHFLRKVV